MKATDQTPERLPLVTGNTSHPAPEVSFGYVQSTDLLKGQKSVVIEHNGSIYRLQATKLGKLILTK